MFYWNPILMFEAWQLPSSTMVVVGYPSLWQEEKRQWISMSFSCGWFFTGKYCKYLLHVEVLNRHVKNQAFVDDQRLRAKESSKYPYTSVITLIFFQIGSDEDALWKVDVRETKEELAARGMNFLIWWKIYFLISMEDKSYWLYH